ncbi:MAG: amino acid adenylation domain-containing protein [Spirochaetaceae bacterium]|nr:amino acid adenylation domain-containing protein [Spirochaetaceae bacterium]
MDYTQLSCLKGRRTDKNSGLTVVDLFRRQARLVPERPAVVYRDYSISYRDFDRLTDIIAAELIRRGLPRGGSVGILADHNEVAPLSVMAALKAGAAYVPLNPQHPSDRLLYMIEDAGINHLISDGTRAERISAYRGTVINGREFSKTLPETASVAADTLPAPTPGDVMIIEYTSGSTGKPKGVMFRHGNIMSFSGHYLELTGLSSADAVTSYASLSFMLHSHDFFPAFMAGAALHIIDDAIRLDPEAVNAYFEKHHIAAAFLPFSFGSRFVLQTQNRSLRALSMAGENFTTLPDVPLGYKVYNAYGCTECGVIAMGEVKPGESRITAGTPVDNADIYLVDEGGNLVRRGEKGELCVSGSLVSAGYLNLDKKTSEVFIPNPFSTEPGYERLYRTGDLARITEDGKVEIIGRADFQIKIRGYRIEPGEIDACIRRYPGVLESVTVAVENKAGLKHLVTYIAAETRIDPASLRDFAAASLPLYMVPQFIEQLDALPRNMSGKVDRARLPPPSFSGGSRLPPETETEKKLAGIWAFVLGLEKDRIDRDADFFELGGDSLRATILTFEVSKAFGTDLSPAEIFKSPVLKDQAGILLIPRGFNAIHTYSNTGGGPPLFFVHGGNVGAETFAEMAGKLPPDRSFYCFENYNNYNFRRKIRGVVPRAEKYIEFMRQAVPRGPYMMGGWSYGGLVAFEMALQLQRQGERVEQLYLLDPNLIRGAEEKKLWERLADPINYRDYLLKDPLFERYRKLGLLDVLIENNREVSEDIRHYKPSDIYRGKVTLFKALKADLVNLVASKDAAPAETAEVFRRLQDITKRKRDNGFGEYAPGLRVIELNEIHDGLIRGEALDAITRVIREGWGRPE